jgi:hypothetical protein
MLVDFPLPRCVALLPGDITDVNDIRVALTSCSLAPYHDSCPSRPISLDALHSEAGRPNDGGFDLPSAPRPVGLLVHPGTALSTGYRR